MAHATPQPPDEKDLLKGDPNRDLVPSSLNEDRPLRQDSAVALRVAGANYSEIARTLGYTDAKSARLAVERALAGTVTPESRDQLRYLEARRLERVLRGLWGKATNEEHPEHLAAARTAIAVIDRHARLYGLDAPQEMVVYTPAAAEIDRWVQAMASSVRGEWPEEADIIEGSVVEDDEQAAG